MGCSVRSILGRIRTVFVLRKESERDDLLKEIQTLKSGQNEESPFSGGLFAKRNLSRGLESLNGGNV